MVGKEMTGLHTKELAELLAAYKTGKLKLRRDIRGKIIPNQEDFAETEKDYPHESPEKKFHLAQASALLRAKREYDREQRDQRRNCVSQGGVE
jgi:hypothetical protein